MAWGIWKKIKIGARKAGSLARRLFKKGKKIFDKGVEMAKKAEPVVRKGIEAYAPDKVEAFDKAMDRLGQTQERLNAFDARARNFFDKYGKIELN